MIRVPLLKPITPMQTRVIELAHLGLKNRDIAKALNVQPVTVAYHFRMASQAIPGDLPVRMRAILWYRGATEAMLTTKAITPDEQRAAVSAVVSAALKRMTPAPQPGVSSALARIRQHQTLAQRRGDGTLLPLTSDASPP